MSIDGPKKIFVDIDGTICSITKDNNYILAEPYPDRIKEINKLYDDGAEITYWTARGQVSGRDWEALTIEQLDNWGAKYHYVLVGRKPHFDLYICDKSINSETFFQKQKFHVTHTTYGDLENDGFHL